MNQSPIRRPALGLALMFSLLLCTSYAAEEDTVPDAVATEEEVDEDGQPLGWPRVIEADGTTITIYSPQVDQFEDDKLEARAAFSAQRGTSAAPIFGLIWISAHARIDADTRKVHLEDVQFARVSSPDAPDRAEAYLRAVRNALGDSLELPLHAVETDLAIRRAGRNAQAPAVRNDAPQIFFSTVPALLVLVDGKPVLRPVEGERLQRVINTRALILRDDASGSYYLPVMHFWMEAQALSGPWAPSQAPPASLNRVKTAFAERVEVDLLDDPDDAVRTLVEGGKAPVVFVSTRPAELLQSQGKPALQWIPDTQLLYVENSANDIFVTMKGQRYYTVLSGRWYSAPQASGPWAFVAPEQLPRDFGLISPDHDKARVLASIPGTEQASETLSANAVPKTTGVKRRDANLQVQYDEEPKFGPIDGTPLHYAVNSATPVISVDTNAYYAVDNGVWYFSPSPLGPWNVTTYVPAVIYSIPVTSPLHYVTYVRVYGATPDVVYYGYTPGYLGTVVNSYGTVVYGTGWYTAPWIGNAWIGWPATYGWGVSFGYGAWAGWNVRFGWGYRPVFNPWWGPVGWCWGRPPGWGWRKPLYGYRGYAGFNQVNVYKRLPGRAIAPPHARTVRSGRAEFAGRPDRTGARFAARPGGPIGARSGADGSRERWVRRDGVRPTPNRMSGASSHADASPRARWDGNRPRWARSGVEQVQPSYRAPGRSSTNMRPQPRFGQVGPNDGGRAAGNGGARPTPGVVSRPGAPSSPRARGPDQARDSRARAPTTERDSRARGPNGRGEMRGHGGGNSDGNWESFANDQLGRAMRSFPSPQVRHTPRADAAPRGFSQPRGGADFGGRRGFGGPSGGSRQSR